MLFCHITSKVEGDKDQDLLQKMGGRGFPTLLWLDAGGEKIAEQGDRTVDGFRKTGQALVTIKKLEQADRSAQDEIEYFLARLALGQLELEEAKKTADSLQATGAAAERVDAALLALEIKEKIDSVSSREAAAEAGKHFAEMVKAGRVPTTKGLATAQFWMMVSEHAYEESAAELFAKCVAGIKLSLGENPQYERIYKMLDQRLEELKQ